MADADKLRAQADQFDGFDLYRPIGASSEDLRRIASLLDAVPPETLEALRAGTWVAVPKEPTSVMLEAAETGYIRSYTGTSTISADKCYRLMISAAPKKPER